MIFYVCMSEFLPLYSHSSMFQHNTGRDGVINIRRSCVKFTGQNYFHGNNGSSLKVRHSSIQLWIKHHEYNMPTIVYHYQKSIKLVVIQEKVKC